MIEKDLGTWAAGASLSHLPEVIGRITGALVVADTNDALGRHPDHLLPKRIGLVVLGVNRDPEFLDWQTINLSQKLPRKLDCVALEVIPKTKITQHLEKRMVPRGITNVFQIIVFTARANAALRSGRALVRTLFTAQEHVLELDHPRVGEEQRRIIDGHQRTRGHDRVPLRLEVL